MQIVRCASCGMMYQNPRVVEAEMADAYQAIEGYSRFPGQDSAKRALFDARIEAMRRQGLFASEGAFLDVGASRGIMLDCVARVLPGWRRFAVELSPTARASLQARGYSCAAAVADLDPREQFDWINIDNVIEHLPNPLGTLIELKSRLRHGGFIYVEAPNESFLPLRYRINDAMRGFRKLPTAEGHVNLFTPRTLKALIRAAGFRCDDFHLESVSVPHRLKGALGGDETPQVRRIFRFLRATRADVALRLAYFLCARIRPA